MDEHKYKWENPQTKGHILFNIFTLSTKILKVIPQSEN